MTGIGKLSEEQKRLVEDNLNLARKLAHMTSRKMSSHAVSDFDDISQVAFFGLIKAAQGYRKEKGAAFSTYAYTIISNDLAKILARNIEDAKHTLDTTQEQQEKALDYPEYLQSMNSVTEYYENLDTVLVTVSVRNAFDKVYEKATAAQKKNLRLLLLSVNDITHAQIAQMMAIDNYKQISVDISRAIALLRKSEEFIALRECV